MTKTIESSVWSAIERARMYELQRAQVRKDYQSICNIFGKDNECQVCGKWFSDSKHQEKYGNHHKFVPKIELPDEVGVSVNEEAKKVFDREYYYSPEGGSYPRTVFGLYKGTLAVRERSYSDKYEGEKRYAREYSTDEAIKAVMDLDLITKFFVHLDEYLGKRNADYEFVKLKIRKISDVVRETRHLNNDEELRQLA